MSSSYKSSHSTMSSSCPCGLTQLQIEKFNKVGSDLRCQAPRLTDESMVCGELLARHPIQIEALPGNPMTHPSLSILFISLNYDMNMTSIS